MKRWVPRRKHSREFKLEAVKQVVQQGRSVTEVADGLGINRNMLTRWKAQFETEGAVAFPGHGRRAETEAEAEIRRLKRELSIAQQERDILKKSRGLLRERKELRFEFVRDHRESFEVGLLCTTLRVSRSGFYAWLGRDESDRARENRELTTLIRGVFDDSREVYGSPRVFRTLRRRGMSCGRHRVARLMRAASLRSKTRRRFRVKTTDSNHSFPIAPDRVDRDFRAHAANQVWVSDMTYVATDEGWLYLAVTMDLFSRKIVGWSMAPSMHADIVINALKMALNTRRPEPGLIHHSDRGSQYASEAFRSLLAERGVLASMSRKGNCYDNAAIESFFHSLKTELVRHEQYRSHSHARASLFDYIETFYNRQRMHSTLGYLSPENFEHARTNVA